MTVVRQPNHALPSSLAPFGAQQQPATMPHQSAPNKLDAILGSIFRLQHQLIERDTLIHELNQNALSSQENSTIKRELKKGFAVIEERHIDTSSTESVLDMSMRYLLHNISRVFKCASGLLLLDVPYNAPLGATNMDFKTHQAIKSYWHRAAMLSPATCAALDDVALYSSIITQKVGLQFSDWCMARLRRDKGDLPDLSSLMACPIVMDDQVIALVLVANGECLEESPRVLTDVLSEMWTPNVQPLINVALDAQRKKDTEQMLVRESLHRDDIILSLDTILDECVTQSLDGQSMDSSSERLWHLILQRVANFFEEYFGSDVLFAVTNTDANFRIQDLHAVGTQNSGGESRRGSMDQALDGSLKFIHYIFSELMRNVRRTKMKGMSHPHLHNSPLMQRVLSSGKPFYSPNCAGIKFPCGHMKMNCLLLVPILFCEEPVGMLGLANGDFSISSGRILQSVFTTFWSMIVKATIMSESQKALNAALPATITDRVKRGEKIADSYVTATVLFADIVGFSTFTEGLSALEVVEYSNLIFSRLDGLVRNLGLEKIKVIGDCYMVAGGLTNKTGKPATRITNKVEQSQMREVVGLAKRILEEAKIINTGDGCSDKIHEKLKTTPLQFRIGISEGPLTAGVFGKGKVQYDVLGATVNLASRLERNSRPGSIQVSEAIFTELSPDGYVFQRRKPICLKGLGMHQTYFLVSLPEASVVM